MEGKWGRHGGYRTESVRNRHGGIVGVQVEKRVTSYDQCPLGLSSLRWPVYRHHDMALMLSGELILWRLN